MELEIGKFVLMYLLLPIIGVILGVVMFVIGKKNLLLNNKKLIYFVLASCVILALPALLGFIDYWFMPYVYILLQVVYLIVGWYYLAMLRWIEKEIDQKPFYVEFLFVLVIMIVAAGIFSLVFNLCNELQYGLWACTCILPFIFPVLFRKVYHSFMEIPLEIYKIWSYDGQDQSVWDDTETDPESERIIVVELEIARLAADPVPLNIKAKASEDMPFGVWFKIFLNDYNIKSSATPITYSDYEHSYGWIFYRLSSVLGRKKYIDPNLSFTQNKMRENQVIIAKRAKYEDVNQMSY